MVRLRVMDCKCTIRHHVWNLVIVFLGGQVALYAQWQGFSGGVQHQTNIFLRDSTIGADNTPQYDHQLIGNETWINLHYRKEQFEGRVRFDHFQNSNLLDPQGSFSGTGIGYWYLSYRVDRVRFDGGYLYDQIGSGIIFRAYEDRTQLIDRALLGGRIEYELAPEWKIRAFTGKQKKQFDRYDTDIRGVAIDGYLDKGAWSISPGVGMVNTTYDEQTMQQIVNVLASYLPDDRVVPQYNTYLTTVYSTAQWRRWNLYFEWAHRFANVFFDAQAPRSLVDGSTVLGKLVKRPGNVFYTSMSYSHRKLGLSIDVKRTQDFEHRTDPLLGINHGIIGFIPPMGRINTYRLTARYAPATQYIGEQGIQIDLSYRHNKRWYFNLNGSYIKQLDGTLLYRELYLEALYKRGRKGQLLFGIQNMRYNFAVYRGKPGAEDVRTWVPYMEWLLKRGRYHSLRMELQYMSTRQDEGDWAFVLLEYGYAPHWLVELSYMYNVIRLGDPLKGSEAQRSQYLRRGRKGYPTVGIVYATGPHRFGLRYVKQTEGVVCSGGICRYEPAFSGVRFQINSTF